MRRALLISTLFLLCIFNALAQNVTVSGTVVDESDLPLIGVGVMQTGTTNGVMTDLDGKYTISAPSGSKLEFTFIGYTAQAFTVSKDRPVINVKLQPDVNVLDETVVIGYGVQKKSDLTGAISAVKTQDMTDRTLTDAAQALQGKTAGVYLSSSSGAPGSESTVRIRGVGSNGSSSPLYVIDGRIAPEGMSFLNPDDIVSVEVLKDGASAAIYGARAGNGVILVTTKKGDGDGRISFQSQVTFQTFGNMPETMNAKEYRDYYLEAGTISASAFENLDMNHSTNWVDELTETSVMQRYTLNFQKGNSKDNIYIAASYMSNDGPVVGSKDKMERLNVMINGNWQFKKWLSLSTNNQIGYGKLKSRATNSVMLAAIRTDPVTKAYYTLDKLKAYNEQYYNYALDPSIMGEVLKNRKGLYYGISKFTSAGVTNPLISLAATDAFTNTLFVSGSTALNFTPFKNFTFTSRFGYRFGVFENNSTTGDYYAGGNTKRPYASVSASLTTPTYYQWENFANYIKDFGKHEITVMAGMSYSQQRSYDITGSYTGSDDDFGFQKDDPRYLYWAYATSGASSTKTLTGAEPLFTRNLSYFGRAGWSYAGKYMLQATLRADAADTSVLPVEERWGYFPAVSAGWTLSREEFYKNFKKYIPYLKLRASWGENGSTASLGSYAYAASMTSSGYYPVPIDGGSSYVTAYIPSYTGNYKLKWETSEQLDLGFDMRFFNDALSVGFDYFNKKTKDLIVTGAKPTYSLGLPTSPLNSGKIENKGIEFEIGWTGNAGDFNYSVRANGATLKNKVTYVDEAVGSLLGTYINPYGYVTRFEAGHPAWYFYGYKFDKINKENGEPMVKDLNGDGIIGDSDLMEIGCGIPKFTFGITLTANWKNWDALVFASGALGQQTYMFYDYTAYNFNKLRYYTKDRWTETNKDGKRPRAGATAYQNYLMSDANVVNSDYMKIKQIQIGYTVPKKVLDKVKISSLRAYLSLDDFFTFTGYPGYDPEIVGTGSGNGIDQGTYPSTRKFVLGLNVSF